MGGTSEASKTVSSVTSVLALIFCMSRGAMAALQLLLLPVALAEAAEAVTVTEAEPPGVAVCCCCKMVDFCLATENFQNDD